VPGGSPEQPPVSDYDLKIDAQVEKFLETKHKLVYFLVTASAAPIVAIVQFMYGKPMLWWISTAASVGVAAGLIAAGSALTVLWCEVASYRNHIQYRYQRKTWEQLTADQKATWDKLNRTAAKFTRTAFVLLCIEFALFAFVGISFISMPPVTTHHGFSIQLSFP
jgi:uncharacterized membrane protein